MRKINSKIITNFVSEKGYDLTNRTYFAYVPLENLVCYAAAESYNSEDDLNSARLAVESVLVAFERKPSLRGLKSYIRYAHNQLKKNSVINVLEAAITVIVSDYTRFRYAVCGNVKFYLLSDNTFYLKSDEQTYFQYAAQKYGKDKVPQSENRNLLQYLGKNRSPRPFVSKEINIPEGSTMVLATCRLWERLHEIEIADAYESSEPSEFADNVEELYLGYQTTNAVRSYTLASMFVQRTYKEDTSKKKKRLLIILLVTGILVAALLITTAVILVMRANDRNAIAEIEALNSDGVRYSNYGNYSRAFEQYESAVKLVDKLSMKNWQYINEKRELSNVVKDRWLLFRGILDGEAYAESGSYSAAQRAYQSVDNIAKSDLELLLSAVLAGRISEMSEYLEIANLVLMGEMYEISEQYGNALLSYYEASDKAKTLNDLSLRKELMLIIFDLNKKIQDKDNEQISAVLDEREMVRQELQREQEQAVEQYKSMAVTAAGNKDYAMALQLYEQVLKLYKDMAIGIQDVRYKAVVDIMAELERNIALEGAE